MDRAAAGPQDRTKAERRVTGRTSAASTNRSWPTPTSPHDGAATPEVTDPVAAAEVNEVADVIPLPVFDARKEAQTWRL